MDTKYRPFFFYGTSQPGSRGFGSTLAHSVSEQAPATLSDAALYIGPSYPVLVRRRGAGIVHGTVCLLDERQFATLVDEIDAQEGYLGEGRSDNLYVRQTVWVDVAPSETWTGAERVRAYVYVGSDETCEDGLEGFRLSPTGDWSHHADEWEEEDEPAPPAPDDRFDDDEDDADRADN